MSEFRVGQRVRVKSVPIDDDDIRSLRDSGIVGVVEDIFEDGELQVRFRDSSAHDALHWLEPHLLDPADPPASDDEFSNVRAWVTNSWSIEDAVEKLEDGSWEMVVSIRRLLDALDAARRERDEERRKLKIAYREFLVVYEALEALGDNMVRAGAIPPDALAEFKADIAPYMPMLEAARAAQESDDAHE